MSRNALLAQVHIGKKSMGLDDDLYRAWLQRETGARSCRDLNDRQLQALVDRLREAGHLGEAERVRPNRPTPAQWRKLLALSREMGWGGQRDNERLAGFIKRTAHVDHPRFLDRRGMSACITGLERWRRATTASTEHPSANG